MFLHKKMNRRLFFSFGIIIFLLLALSITVYAVQQSQLIGKKAAEPGKILKITTSLPSLSYQIDKILGQPDTKQTMMNRIVANRGFHMGGVHIDSQDRIYVVDSGNNRILGFQSYQGPDQYSDIVIGQPQLTDAGAANTDNTQYLSPTASSLALLPYPAVISTAESPRFLQLATDSNNNLYVFDLNNNRVLKYNDPFNTDQIADDVWGQSDFTSRQAYCGQTGFPLDNQHFCTEWGSIFNGLTDEIFGAGVDIDRDGNLWAADTGNHRVLRFPNQGGMISKTADLVLGQPDFTTRNYASCWSNDETNRSKMWKPLAVRVHPDTGEVYVLDGQEAGQTNRILVFTSPFTNGMAASREMGRAFFQDTEPPDPAGWISVKDCVDPNKTVWVHLSTGLNLARGIGFNKVGNGVLWVNDANNNRIILFDSNGSIIDVIGQTSFDSISCDGEGTGYQQPDGSRGPLCQNYGEIGIDSQGRLYAGKTYLYRDISAFPMPLQKNAQDQVIADRWLLHASNPGGGWNQFSGKTFQGAYGLSSSPTIEPPQLFVSDGQRVLVWNNYQNVTTYQEADYVIGQDTKDANFNNNGGTFSSVLAGAQAVGGGYLWVTASNRIFAFALPINSGGKNYQPNKILYSGVYSDVGNVYWADDSSKVSFAPEGIAYDPNQNAIWISDWSNNRVLRIADPLGEAKVDLVLGQPDKSSTGDNAGQSQINAQGFANPWSLNFDKLGNLYVVDAKFESGCNDRVLRFNTNDLIPQPGNIFPMPNASGVYAKQHFNTCDLADSWGPGTPQSPNWVGFDSQNRMIMLVDSYGNNQYERVFIYPSTHASETTPQPTSIIPLALGQGAFAFFDPDDNHLIVQDLTWSRTLFITLEYPISPSPTPTVTPTITPTPTLEPSATPTPIPTPTPILRNGSFETDDDNNNLPDSWTPKNLDANDILDTAIIYDGIKSFRFSPATGKQEKLYQSLNKTGGADEEVRLEIYNQSDGQVVIGNAGVILNITYADGRKETTSGVFPYAVHSWKKKTLIIVTDEPYSQIKVQFYNSNKDTNVRVDKASLTISPNAHARGIKTTTNELTPKELLELDGD